MQICGTCHRNASDSSVASACCAYTFMVKVDDVVDDIEVIVVNLWKEIQLIGDNEKQSKKKNHKPGVTPGKNTKD